MIDMEPANPASETDSPFTNDQLTDLVIHKDDASIIRNGEIINEPDDVEEKAIAGGIENEAHPCSFPIHFNYDGKDYTADVQKTKSLFAEYHVSGVYPQIDHLPEPFIVAEHFTAEKFDFPVNETYYPQALGISVVKAINESSTGRTGFF